jgi:hypothetical protein
MTENTQPAPPPKKHRSNEEPDIGFEESIPSDGKDPVGEAMIDSLDKDEPAHQPDKLPPARPAGPFPEQLPVS